VVHALHCCVKGLSFACSSSNQVQMISGTMQSSPAKLRIFFRRASGVSSRIICSKQSDSSSLSSRDSLTVSSLGNRYTRASTS
jgi:hypothetical protein